jgi:energy-coupling factor transporter ATP-binding protein EcfA2
MITDFPEPLSEASIESSKPVILIESDALRILKHELHRYCESEVTGRSFLISGHRGSGKTTVVLGCIQQLLKDSERRELGRRPLLIPLHGPNLLPGCAVAKGGNNKGQEQDSAKHGGVRTPGDDESVTRTVLEQITLGLYRAVVKEFTLAFRQRQWFMLEHPLRQKPTSRMRDYEQAELHAQLALELDECSGTMRLRDLWSRAGLLQRGVLFPFQLPYQGFRELVALTSVIQAYRRIAGEVTRKQIDSDKGKSEEKQSSSVETASKKQDLTTPLTALLTGGLVGTGAYAGTNEAISSVIAGIVAAFGSSVVLKRSTSRSRERSVSREDMFLPDLSASTLDRVLPVLIQRLREAGLIPIFLVDELDKVTSLSDRIVVMVHRLKTLVAENAFFCFLTDRRYFEEMRNRAVEIPYPVEYTYYTHQLFMVFRPNDLHRYLTQVLALSEGEEPKPQQSQDLALSDDLADYPLLPYILLHQSQMHPIDLRRALAALRGPDGGLILRPGA